MGTTIEKAKVTNERSLKGGEIGNSMEKQLRDTSLMGLGQFERRQKNYASQIG